MQKRYSDADSGHLVGHLKQKRVPLFWRSCFTLIYVNLVLNRHVKESCTHLTCTQQLLTHSVIEATLKMTFKLLWKPFDQQFGQQLNDFRQHHKNVEEEAGLAHMIESADARAMVLADQKQLEKRRRGQIPCSHSWNITER